jgi:hypothetical protein
VLHGDEVFRTVEIGERQVGRESCSADTRQYCALGFTCARSSSNRTATPSKALSNRLQVVTQ